MDKLKSELVDIQNKDNLAEFLGVFDQNLKTIERAFDVRLFVLDGHLKIEGKEEDVVVCKSVVERLLAIIKKGNTLDKSQLLYYIGLAKDGKPENITELSDSVVAITANGKIVKCKTIGQKKYVENIKNNTVTLGVGPAGTGKTFLAVATAFVAFKNKEVEKIILTRPAVEAGEKLGFLPGDMQEKIDPYLRPLYDALQEFFGLDKYAALIEKNVIEIAPLAYMRGRTLSNAFIILDEAQNSTVEQMKMFLTRLGKNSKMVVTGDITQIDLPYGKESGLKNAIGVLKNVDGVAINLLDDKDVVRNPLVSKIVKAYEISEKEKRAKGEEKENER